MCNKTDEKRNIPAHSVVLTRYRLQPPLADIQSRQESVNIKPCPIFFFKSLLTLLHKNF